MSNSSQPHGPQPTRLLCPWDFPGKSTGVGAIAFSELALALLIVVVVSLTECLTPFFPMDCSPPGSPVHGISQARIREWVAISFSRGPLHLLHCRQILYHLSHQGRPLARVSVPLHLYSTLPCKLLRTVCPYI